MKNIWMVHGIFKDTVNWPACACQLDLRTSKLSELDEQSYVGIHDLLLALSTDQAQAVSTLDFLPEPDDATQSTAICLSSLEEPARIL